MKCLNAVIGFFTITGILVILALIFFRGKAEALDTTSVQEEVSLQTEIAEMTESSNQCCCCCCCCNRNNEGGEQE